MRLTISQEGLTPVYISIENGFSSHTKCDDDKIKIKKLVKDDLKRRVISKNIKNIKSVEEFVRLKLDFKQYMKMVKDFLLGETDLLLPGESNIKVSKAIKNENMLRNLSRSWIKDYNTFFYINNRNNIEGFIALKGHDKYIFVSKLYVDEKYRGKGISKELMYSAENFALDRKINKLKLCCLWNNEKAYSVYKHLGFKDDKS